jgi:hypothetical protein
MHWVHETYWQPGPQGNDIHKTNVPNLRMRFRYDNHQEEARALAFQNTLHRKPCSTRAGGLDPSSVWQGACPSVYGTCTR